MTSLWGSLPGHWKVLPLKRLGRFEGGGTPSKDNVEYWKGDIPWVSPKDMKSRVVVDSEDKITEQAIQESATRLVPTGSLLIVVRSGILKHSIPAAITGRAVALNQDLQAFVSCGAATSEYLRSFIEGHQPQLLVLWRKAGATVESLELDLVANTGIPVPPITEQRAIATFVDRESSRIDALIGKKERLLALLEEKRTALVTRAVTKGLDPTVPMKDADVEWLGKIPVQWEVKRLKHVTSVITSGSRGWAEYYSDKGPLFLRIGNLPRKGIELDFSDVQRVEPPQGAEGERTRVNGGDVLVSITAFIGSIGLVPDPFEEAYVNQHIALARARQDDMSPRWIAYCLSSDVGQVQCSLALYGGTKEGLGLDDVGNLRVLVPPRPEQETIVAYLDQQAVRVDSLKNKVGAAIALLREYRTALISAAVTGQVDVQQQNRSR